MFKLGSFDGELRSSMEKILVAQNVEKQFGFDKLNKAIENLNSAAKILEGAGMTQLSDQIDKIISDITAELSQSPAPLLKNVGN